MRLTDLQPQFVRFHRRVKTYQVLKPNIDPLRGNWTEDDWMWVTGPVDSSAPVTWLAEADGIRFLCPLCIGWQRGSSIGIHSVECWFEGKVPDDAVPKPGRWNPTGQHYSTLSFVPGAKSRSVLLIGGCAAHFFITDGEVSP